MDRSADTRKMAPKNNYDPSENSSNNVDEADLQELAAVNDSLDQLSTALDSFEQKTDNIIEQLKELLHSNREVRQEFAAKREAAASGTNANITEEEDMAHDLA